MTPKPLAMPRCQSVGRFPPIFGPFRVLVVSSVEFESRVCVNNDSQHLDKRVLGGAIPAWPNLSPSLSTATP